LDTYNYIYPPTSTVNEPESDSSYADKYFEFDTNDSDNADNDYYKGTAIYYKIYTNLTTLQTQVSKLETLVASDDTAATSSTYLIDSYAYQPLTYPDFTGSVLIPANSSNSNQTVYVRLTDYQESVSEDLKIDEFDNWSIKFVPEKEIAEVCKTLGGASNYPLLSGLTVFTKKTVMLSNNKASAASSIMHEFGHVLDYESGWVSRTEEWAEIYKAERKALRQYVQSSPKEFFADVYSNLALNDRPERTPRATEFVLSVISKH